jgi:hypothetical protein
MKGAAFSGERTAATISKSLFDERNSIVLLPTCPVAPVIRIFGSFVFDMTNLFLSFVVSFIDWYTLY